MAAQVILEETFVFLGIFRSGLGGTRMVRRKRMRGGAWERLPRGEEADVSSSCERVRVPRERFRWRRAG